MYTPGKMWFSCHGTFKQRSLVFPVIHTGAPVEPLRPVLLCWIAAGPVCAAPRPSLWGAGRIHAAPGSATVVRSPAGDTTKAHDSRQTSVPISHGCEEDHLKWGMFKIKFYFLLLWRTDLQCSFEFLQFFLSVFFSQVPLTFCLFKPHLQSVLVIAKSQRQLNKCILQIRT